ncbi:MAG: PEP-CTERM sorting domain-containing protein [Kiritimatiellae bacterium]|jgi:hypothetical protein|nr:PEP-CTERM sorting domain-containing protein [Kiritimatiellia bacterium]MDD4340805.1 PEP-CTERM sorting domain-containing protein [Kiritimatiellia bacterium]MDY0149153.1 PEP-CTERM sorting domain-containing protein [Kiritimatiellia bacterium]
MKKILLALMILACAVSVASAAVHIEWTTGWGLYDHTATDLSGSENYLLDSYALTWQLIYSPDATADAPNLANSSGGWVSGDDEVWATRTLAQSVVGANVTASDGSVWYNYLGYVSNVSRYQDASWQTAGYIYQRAFEGTPAVGSWYYETEPVTLYIDPPSWQTDNLDIAGGGTAGVKPDQQFTAIPEPATMGLLGLGALVMALRRRRA